MRQGNVRNLSIFGGPRAFAGALHVGCPNLGDRQAFLKRVEAILDSRWFTNDGPMVREFETRICEVAGVKNCIAMCNATVALEIAIRSLELRGEVIVPSYTFVATAHALQWQEIRPVFADIDSQTHNMDVSCIERLITPRTTGIIGVHVWGRPCDTEAIDSLAARHNLAVMYDAAHAFGCSHRGRMIGNFGRCEVFSFHATKFLNSFEGGAVVTNDDALAQKIRLMRNFGFAGYDRVIYPGVNGKMTEICAAMGLTNLEALDELISVNHRNYEFYAEGLCGLPGVQLIKHNPCEKCNFQYCVAEVDPAVSPLTRDELVSVLHAENVLARRYFWPGVHNMEPYRSRYPQAGRALPQTERIAARVMVLPTGTAVGQSEIATICGIIREAMEQPDAVRAALGRCGARFTGQQIAPPKEVIAN